MQRVYLYRVYEKIVDYDPNEDADDTSISDAGEESEESESDTEVLISMGFIVAEDRDQVADLLSQHEWGSLSRVSVTRWKGGPFLLNLVIPDSFGAPADLSDDEAGGEGEAEGDGEAGGEGEGEGEDGGEGDDFVAETPPAFVQGLFTIHPESACEKLSELSGIPILSVDNDFPFFVYRLVKGEDGEYTNHDDDMLQLTRVDRDALLDGDWVNIPEDWDAVNVELGQFAPRGNDPDPETQTLFRPVE